LDLISFDLISFDLISFGSVRTPLATVRWLTLGRDDDEEEEEEVKEDASVPRELLERRGNGDRGRKV
jgi:hypothetical protein